LSTKKDKLLERAQKFIAKGQLDRAIKEYAQIVALEPGDIRQRQKLAELLVRVNRKEEAIEEYEVIAKHFSNDHFFLKAIAVYKQVQKLDPANINTRLALASLYAKQGLTGNALTEYTLALNHYQKEGSLEVALTVIEQMLAADPENLETHQKYAETCLAAGQKDKAYLEFVSLAILLRKGGDETVSARIRERVRTLFPDDRDFDYAVLSTQIEEGDTAGALPHLQGLLHIDNADPKAWRLLARSYIKARETGATSSMLGNIINPLSDVTTALDRLTAAVIAEWDIDASLDLLEAEREMFPSLSLGEYYATLHNKAPDNARVIQGLKNAGIDGGETEQPAGAVAAIDSLPLESIDRGAEQALSPPCEAPVISEVPPPAPMAPADDMSWEEEIDLSLLEEEGMNHLFADTGENISASPASLADSRALPDLGLDREDIFQGEDISIESQDFSEISLEIDESDISDSKWLQDFTPLEPADAGSMETGWEAGEGPVGIPPEEGKSESPTAAESTFRTEGDSPVTDTVEIREKAEKAPPVVKKRIKYVLDGDFSQSREGAGQQLDKGDTETHFNLGIAYKEMGLFDEAISEFQTAATDPKRKIDCLTLEGICQRDKGDFAGAEDVFINTLALEGLTDEEKLSLNYELAFLCESAGRHEDAVRYYREVRAINPGFRDAAKKIAHLQGSDEPEETELLELDVEEFDP
jgi:tetratricopeptide (TPR) repeat protein